jgi:TIR domain
LFHSADNISDRFHDIFISYRRSDGSQLASLIKIALENRGYTVFLDVAGLSAGIVRSSIKQSIKQAKFFLLILTKDSLKACIGDHKGKDWVHAEIAIALNASCEIIPILVDTFVWPAADELPADMRKICKYNGVKWVHDYQEACLERLDRFG